MVAVLFTQARSVYHDVPHVQVYDRQRDALTWPGGCPVVAHPPCRLWGRLRQFSTAPPAERALALWAVAMVRRYGGVLEHPAASTLWPAARLPRPHRAASDPFGGFTLDINQAWFGHRAQKRTWLYVCGVAPASLPSMPLSFSLTQHVISNPRHLRAGDPGYRPELSHAARTATPPALAAFLIDTARRCRPHRARRAPDVPVDPTPAAVARLGPF